MEQNGKSLKSLKKFSFAVVAIVEGAILLLLIILACSFIQFTVLEIDKEWPYGYKATISTATLFLAMISAAGVIFASFTTYFVLDERYG